MNYERHKNTKVSQTRYFGLKIHPISTECNSTCLLSISDDCKDKHIQCAKWMREGKCEHSADGFDVQSVQNVCPKSCGICLP